MNPRKIVLVVVVAIFAVAVAFLIAIDDKDVQKDVYARLCAEIVRESLLRPSTMEIVRIQSSTSGKSLDDSLSRITSKNHSENLEAQILQIVRQAYDDGLENSVVSIFIDYSAENKLGGANRDVAICDVLEDVTFTRKNSLVTVLIGSNRITSSQFGEFFLLKRKPDRLDALYQLDNITVWDRLRFVIDPIELDP